MKKDKKGIFASLQLIGKSFFLPIAILPFAGILLGIGSSFTNETTIATYGLENILHPGTVLYSIMLLMADAGNIIFRNLPLIFALSVAFGMAQKEKGVAIIGSTVFYLIMLMTIHTCLVIKGVIAGGEVADGIREGAISTVLGIQTLEMGVFGGIIAGLISALLCNKFYKIELPNALSFCAGTRFVPIVCMFFGLITGVVLFFVWPLIQEVIFKLGAIVQESGYFGTFLYGMIERALIPFGLHHIFYIPFWQTGVGGTAIIDGITYMGAQNIFFAELASPNTTAFSIDACRFLTGKYPFMMGGLPGAALAMYVTSKKENKKVAGSLLLSAALTSFLTGITEPIEFTFLFLAPALFGLHVIMAGISFATCHMLNICIGTTFSDGLIDFILYGVLPGNDKSNWIMMIPVLIVYFLLYFIIFKYLILKFDIKTPGRGDDDMHLVSKAEYMKKAGVSAADDKKSAMILSALGGKKNIENIDCCATRLRVSVKDIAPVDEALLKKTGASAVIKKDNGLQIIYGPSVTIIKSELEEYIETAPDTEVVYVKHTDIIIGKNAKTGVSTGNAEISADGMQLTYKIKDPLGIHARPAGQLAKTAAGYKCRLTVLANGKEAEIKSVLSIMNLGVKQGDTVKITALGDDAQTAISTFAKYLEKNL